MTMENRDLLLQAYSEGHQALVDALAKYPKEAWTFRPAPGQWTIHEIVVHITDSDVNSYARMRKILAEPGSTIMVYDQDAWAKKLNYHQLSTELYLALLKQLRLMNLQILENLPESAWQQAIEHPENGRETLEEWLIIYSKHIPKHLNQMDRVFKAWQESQKAHY